MVVDLDPLDRVDRRDADVPAAVGELLEAVLVVELRVAPPGGLERVGERGGVLYVNDSKATNVAAAAAALRSFERPVHAILGGSLKGSGFEDLAGPVREHATACYLIGEAADAIERDLELAWSSGVRHSRHDALAAAVAAAASAARPGDVVLLAPACASFDAYRDFEARGQHFRALVEDLQ